MLERLAMERAEALAIAKRDADCVAEPEEVKHGTYGEEFVGAIAVEVRRRELQARGVVEVLDVAGDRAEAVEIAGEAEHVTHEGIGAIVALEVEDLERMNVEEAVQRERLRRLVDVHAGIREHTGCVAEDEIEGAVAVGVARCHLVGHVFELNVDDAGLVRDRCQGAQPIRGDSDERLASAVAVDVDGEHFVGGSGPEFNRRRESAVGESLVDGDRTWIPHDEFAPPVAVEVGPERALNGSFEARGERGREQIRAGGDGDRQRRGGDFAWGLRREVDDEPVVIVVESDGKRCSRPTRPRGHIPRYFLKLQVDYLRLYSSALTGPADQIRLQLQATF